MAKVFLASLFIALLRYWPVEVFFVRSIPPARDRHATASAGFTVKRQSLPSAPGSQGYSVSHVG
jgi:hypothetical protein